MASADSCPSPPPSPARAQANSVILLNTLHYTLSAKEYETFHEYIITHSPKVVRRKAPPPHNYSSIVQTNGDFNAAAVRVSLRVFIASQTGLKLWDMINEHIFARGKPRK